jgi:sigma-54 dependent transcriptional regulator, acetoin dehydrogenase operon transcriptional activator AcoR
MDSVYRLLDQDGLLKSIFESIPCGVLIMDKDRTVRAVNNALERTFGLYRSEAISRRGGDVLHCVHASEVPEGCGYSSACQDCQVRSIALDAISGRKIERRLTEFQFRLNGKAGQLRLLLSAAPFSHNNERLAIIIMEDITELAALRRRLKAEQSFAGIIGSDPVMNDLFETIRDVADINIPVLIEGESGTGKELVASAIHNEGTRADKPFVPVNCAALPEGIIESELFGHVKGAFTGAVRDKRGRFELAHGGTLFLDEVGDLPKSVQAKLLRVLQDGCFERVGGERSVSVDVRIISATNRSLKREVEKGNFREDLYYRLKVMPVHLPPLRKRKGDIPLLVDHFLKRAVDDGFRPAEISNAAMASMMEYPWPGNVRELQGAVRFALIKTKGNAVQPGDLPMEIRNRPDCSQAPGPSKKLDIERVRAALTKSGGNRSGAAKMLGVGRATLYRFLVDFPDVS